MKFKVTYQGEAWEIIEAKDIFSLFDVLKRRYKHYFKMPVRVEQCD